MTVQLPAGSPARTYALTDFGRYTDVDSTLVEPRTLRIDSTLSSTGSSSILVRSDVTRNIAGAIETFAAYTVLRGRIVAFPVADVVAELSYVASVSSLANVQAFLRGQR